MFAQLHHGSLMSAALLLLALSCGGATIDLCAQARETPYPDANAKVPAYEVVSIRPSAPNDRNTGWETLPNGFDFRNAQVFWLVYQAYGIQMDSQISGLPAWVKTDRYYVSTRADADTVAAWQKLSHQEMWNQQRLMLQAMLADRFQLKIRHEVKVPSVYDLVIAKGGLKMKEAAPDEKAYSEWKQMAFYGGANEGEYTITATFHAGTAQGLAQNLPSYTGRVIVDKTGLGDKRFDFELKWSTSGQAPQDGGDAGPMLFKALEEQLGLKLEPAKGPVDTFAVEHIERPSEN